MNCWGAPDAGLAYPCIVCLGIISMALFRDRIKQAHIFIALCIGSLFHLLLDLMVKSMDGRVMLFFPFSFESYSFNIFAQEDFIFLYIAIVVVLMSFGVRRYYGCAKNDAVTHG